MATGSAATGITGALWYHFETRGQNFEAFDDATDPLAQGRFGQAFNPHSNETLSDIYVARVPLSRIRPDLIEDYNRGGSKLVERYCSGMLGGWGAFIFLLTHAVFSCIKRPTFDSVCYSAAALHSPGQ